jgi:hypothetical protein
MRTSKSAVQRSIKSGLATVNGVAVTKASASVRAGDRISYREFKPEPQTCAPEPIELDIKYEDGDLIVVNKPAGMTVHPAKGLVSGTLVNALLHHVGAKAITLHADEDEDGAADGDADESDDEGVHQLSQMRIIQDTLPRGRRVHPEDCAVAAPHPKFALALTALHNCDTWAAPTNGRGLGAGASARGHGWVGGWDGRFAEGVACCCLLAVIAVGCDRRRTVHDSALAAQWHVATCSRRIARRRSICGSASSGVIRPGIVHRIDRETSGLLVVAKSDPIHAALSVQFAQHTSKRTCAMPCGTVAYASTVAAEYCVVPSGPDGTGGRSGLTVWPPQLRPLCLHVLRHESAALCG